MAAGDANQSASPAVIALVDYHFGDIENGVAICRNLRSNKIGMLDFYSRLILYLQRNTVNLRIYKLYMPLNI